MPRILMHFYESAKLVYVYQFGLGRNLIDREKDQVFALLELDGTYSEKNKWQGFANPNSGGNVVFITPSISYTTLNYIAQLGVSVPVAQKLFGVQPKNLYYISAAITITNPVSYGNALLRR